MTAIRLTTFALVLACALAWSATTQARMPPAKGRFLVATGPQHGFFAHSVVLLLAYGPKGALGLIINRPSRFTLAKALPGTNMPHRGSEPLYFGGPVSLKQVTFLVYSITPPPEARLVMKNIYASTSRKALHFITSHEAEGVKFRGYAGFAGWSPAQLDNEIARGDWKVLPASADEIFTTSPSALWEKLRRHQGGIFVYNLLQTFPSTNNCAPIAL